MKIGVPYDTFWHLSPYEFDVMVDGYIEQQKHQNYMNWTQGIYMVSALGATVGNMFRKNTSEQNKYMDKPLPLYEESKELSEDEKVSEEQKLLLALETMQMAFEQNK